ncbi:MAG: beta-ketoacyl-[acyl-carrier-protein] synthase II [Deltaproteobacteria bacterium]|nr:beta-ketoacyl-[acyl-carrier-protein] synthase II [Deltaproteobacteria bacterium]
MKYGNQLRSKVAVTSFQTISSLGIGNQETLHSLERGVTCLTKDHPLADYAGCPIGPVRNELTKLPPTFKDYDTRCNRLAASCLESLSVQVRDLKSRHESSRIAVVTGTTSSGFRDLEDKILGGLDLGDFDYRSTIPVGSVASFISKAFGFDGPSMTCSTACSSSGNAIITACNLIYSGICDAAVVGGFEALARTTLMGFKSLRVIDPEPCRPFDAFRKGMNLGEGAAVLIMERVYGQDKGQGAFIAGYGSSLDAHHMTAPDPSGLGAETAMAAALARAGVTAEDIGYINLHGTGTILNDAAEATAINRLFGNKTKCSSTKGMSGHLLGASSAFETVLCIISLERGFAPNNTGLERLDPEMDIEILDEPTAIDKNSLVMSNSFGFGGNNTSIIIGRA